MRHTYGSQQGDRWLKNRIGRFCGSEIQFAGSYLTRKSGDKKAGDSSAKRDEYKLKLISERLTGRAKEQYNSPAMQRGASLEDDARIFYEKVTGQMCIPVNFVLHPLYDFAGASADSLVGTDGVLEIKCLLPWNHLEYVLAGEIPKEYIPQVAWELACTERKWCDFVLYCPDIEGCDRLRFFYRRIRREDLRWTVQACGEEIELAGEDVITYFTAEVLKLNAEIEHFMAENNAHPIAPYPVQLIEDEEGGDEEVTEESVTDYICQATELMEAP